MVLFTPVLQAHFFCSILHLCISDTNKNLLVQSVGLIGLLLDALFLADDHERKDAPDSEKAPAQTDAAAACLQLALFEPGRALLQNDPTLMHALRALASGKALTAEGKLSAHSALVAIEGVPREPEPEMEGGEEIDTHIMM